MILFTDETADSLYRGVLAEPDNDLQRLVLADWLEEQGQAERAEFIRVQIEIANWESEGNPGCAWGGTCGCLGHESIRRERSLTHDGLHQWFKVGEVQLLSDTDLLSNAAPLFGTALVAVRRGFPAEVRAPLDWLRGGERERGEGRGHVLIARHRADDCPTCHGTGRTPGHLRELVKRWPIQRVVVTDHEPYPSRPTRVAWFHPSVPSGHEPPTQRLPAEVFLRLTGYKNNGAAESRVRWYDTREAAVTALSDALLQEARSVE